MPGRRPAGVARFMRPVRSVRSVRPVRAAAVRSVRFFRASIRFRFSCRFGPGEDARTETPGRLFLTSKVASTPFHRTGCGGEDRFGFCRDGERPRGACRCRRPVCSAGLPSGRSDAEYILGRRSCFSPGRAQRRRPVRVLPRRRTAEGGLPLPPTRVQCRFAFGEVRCGIYPRKKKLFFAGPGAEPRSVRSYRRKRGDGPYEPFFRVGSCCGRSLRSTAREGGAPKIGGCLRSAGFGVYGSLRAVRFRGPRFEKRRTCEEALVAAVRGRLQAARPENGEILFAVRSERTARAGASQLGNRSPPILLRESAGEAPVRWW